MWSEECRFCFQEGLGVHFALVIDFLVIVSLSSSGPSLHLTSQ